MRPDRVVVLTPLLDHDRGLCQRVEYLAVQQFIAQLAIEGLNVAVLPGATGLDVGGLGSDRGNPFPQVHRNELRTIVGPNVLRYASGDEQITEDRDDVGGVEPPRDLDCQTLPRELIDDAQHTIRLSIVRPVGDKVVGPDMVGPFRLETDAGISRDISMLWPQTWQVLRAATGLYSGMGIQTRLSRRPSTG